MVDRALSRFNPAVDLEVSVASMGYKAIADEVQLRHAFRAHFFPFIIINRKKIKYKINKKQ